MASNDQAAIPDAAGPNRRVVLAARPAGAAALAHFRVESQPVPPLEDGRMLVGCRWLSLDPYMRGRMDAARSYAQPVAVGETMVGGATGVVLASRHPAFAVGDRVQGPFGWQTHAVSDGQGVSRLPDDPAVPESAYLGVLGMPGVTAWYGLERILAPQSGQTVCVSAASGAVGSVVVQLAKAAGCRVVGVAGGSAKCAQVLELYGADACVDHRRGRLDADLAIAAPDGIDRLFENVGGGVLDAELARMNRDGRIAICGLIAGYDGQEIALRAVRSILVNRLMVQGFIISDHPQVWPQARAALTAAFKAGTLRRHETIAEGIDQAPRAFLDLLAGRNVGKQLVRIA